MCIGIFFKFEGVFSFIYKTVSVHPPLSKSPGAAGGVIGYWTHRAIATIGVGMYATLEGEGGAVIPHLIRFLDNI